MEMCTLEYIPPWVITQNKNQNNQIVQKLQTQLWTVLHYTVFH